MYFHEVYADKERCIGFLGFLKKREPGLLDIGIKEGDADNTLIRRVDVFPVDLEVLDGLFSRLAGERAFRDFLEHLSQFRVHRREPVRIAIGVRIKVIQENMLHLVITLRVRQRIVGFPQVPFPGEIGLVARLLED